MEEVDRIQKRKRGESAEDPEAPQRVQRGRRRDVSLAYVAELLFPPGFIEAVIKDFGDDELANHLTASKLGFSSCWELFLRKMHMYKTYFSFARVKFTPIEVPDELLFDAYDVEQALHLLYTPVHDSGEHYQLTPKMKDDIKAKLTDLGCVVGDPIELEFSALQSKTETGGKGNVYFGKIGWSATAKSTIEGIRDNSAVESHKRTAKDMLAIKVGAAELLQPVKGESKRRQHRGSGYKWALSRFGPMNYVGFESENMFVDEWSIQKELSDDDKHVAGEWFDTTLAALTKQYITDVPGRVPNHGKRERTLRREWVYDNMLKKWLDAKLITGKELAKLYKNNWIFENDWVSTKMKGRVVQLH